jgi:hypothetical protein
MCRGSFCYDIGVESDTFLIKRRYYTSTEEIIFQDTRDLQGNSPFVSTWTVMRDGALFS